MPLYRSSDSQLATLESEISTLESEVTSLQNNTATSTAVATNTTNIAANTASIVTLNSEVSTLQSAQTSQGSNITSINGSITTLNSEVATNTANISSNTSSITTLNSNVATNASNITANASSINTLNSEVSSLQSTQTSQASSITTINGEISSLQNGVAANSIPSTVQTSPVSGDYIFAISSSGTPYKITEANLFSGLSSGSSSPVWIYKNSNYTASSGDNIIADCSSGSFTITLPAAPSNGKAVTIGLGKNNSSNSNIVGIAASSGFPYSSFYINTPNTEVTLVYFTSTGWSIIGSYSSIPTVPTFPLTPKYRFSAAQQSGYVNGVSVGSISDSSGNNITATASGTAQPTYKTNIINGYPALLFNGSTNYLDLGNANLIADPGDFVIFQVVNYGTTASCSYGGGNATSGNWGLQMSCTNDYSVAGGSLVQTNLTMSLNTWYIKAFARLSNVWKSWVNGGTNISGGSNSGAIRGVSGGYENRDIIGAKWDGSAQNFTNGYIAETTIVLSPTLANINSIGAYYSSMYGITWNTAS
ncbi:MAG: hypothetical protein V7K67_22305 [Nostoc sp.]|uniref:hypothetical protein n=1 Tax=Nostoc sp. TaxID=1180 RepID=UPI002FF7D914